MSSDRTGTNSDVNWARNIQYRIFVSAAFRLRIVNPDGYFRRRKRASRLSGLQMSSQHSQ